MTRHLAVKLPSADPLLSLAPQEAFDNSVMLRKSGLFFVRGVGFNKWETIGRRLLSITESTTWWIADWIAYGEQTFQDRYREAVQETSLSYQTLRNYAWVARRFDLSRRHDNLSFGHHAEVAALEQPEQDYWLRKADELTWSRNALRNEVRNSLRIRRADDESREANTVVEEEQTEDPGEAGELERGNAGKILSLRPTPRQFARFAMAARSGNQGLEEWALQTLDNVCLSLSELRGRSLSGGKVIFA